MAGVISIKIVGQFVLIAVFHFGLLMCFCAKAKSINFLSFVYLLLDITFECLSFKFSRWNELSLLDLP